MLELASQKLREGDGPFDLAIAIHAAVEKLPCHFGRGKLGGGVASESIESGFSGELGGVIYRPEDLLVGHGNGRIPRSGQDCQ